MGAGMLDRLEHFIALARPRRIETEELANRLEAREAAGMFRLRSEPRQRRVQELVHDRPREGLDRLALRAIEAESSEHPFELRHADALGARA